MPLSDSPYGAFVSAFNDETDRIDRKRLDYARAFNEFRRLNPHATLAELQQEVDSIYGGSSLLTPVPSGQLLSDISARNAQEKQRFDTMNRIDMLAKQSQMQSSVLDNAQRIAMQHGDPASAATAFYDLYGNDPEIRKMVSPDAFNGIQGRASLDFVRQNVDTAISLIDSGTKDLTSAFPGVNKTHLSALQTAAQGKINERNQAREREIEGQEFTRMATMAKIGAAYTPGANVPENMHGRLMSNWQTIADREKTSSLATVADAMRQQPEVATRLLNGDEAGVRSLVTQQLKMRLGALGEPSERDVSTIVDQLRTVASNVQETNRKTLMTDADKLATDQLTKEGTLRREQALASFATEQQQKQLFGANKLFAAQMTQTFKTMLEDQKLNLTDSDVTQMAHFLRTDEKAQKLLAANGASPASIIAALRGNEAFKMRLEAAAPERQLATARDTARRSLGLFPTQRADEYVRGQLQDYASPAKAEEVRGVVTKLVSDTSRPAAARLQELRDLRGRILAGDQQLQSELASRLKNARNWADVNGPTFSSENTKAIYDAHKAYERQLLQIIDAAEPTLKIEAGKSVGLGGGAVPLPPQRQAAIEKAKHDPAFRVLMMQIQDPRVSADKRAQLRTEAEQMLQQYLK